MALTASSRYTTAQEETSTIVTAVRKRDRAAIQYNSYTSREGDTFELLAVRLYKDPTQYWRIADANPQVKFPDVIPTGTQLRLPV